MLSMEYYYKDGSWWYALVETARTGQVVDRLPPVRCTSPDVARLLGRSALLMERNKRNALLV